MGRGFESQLQIHKSGNKSKLFFITNDFVLIKYVFTIAFCLRGQQQPPKICVQLHFLFFIFRTERSVSFYSRRGQFSYLRNWHENWIANFSPLFAGLQNLHERAGISNNRVGTLQHAGLGYSGKPRVVCKNDTTKPLRRLLNKRSSAMSLLVERA